MAKRSKKKDSIDAREYFDREHGSMTLGRALRAIRTTQDATLAVMAARIGISVPHLSDVEKGRRAVSVERVARWAKLLGYPPSSLIELALQAQVDAAGVKARVRLEAA